MKIALIPQPQKIVYDGGLYIAPRRGAIGITDNRLYPVAAQLRRLIHGGSVNIHAPNLSETISIRLARQQKTGGYKLQINSRGIILEADSPPAAFWGAQTLLQIARQSPAGLPGVRIDDWPDFQDRGIYYDISRARVPKLERLMEMADNLAKYKINQLQLYIEHTFAFRGHPAIGRGASPLTAEDILKLDAYCRERYIELVPSLSSFGHLSTVLKHPQYHHLAEDWGKGKYITPDRKIRQQMDDWIKKYKHLGFTLSPANPETYRFLDSLFAEFLPLFSSKRFNACCDETVDLGYGQSYKLCQRIGRGRLYLSHIIKLNELSNKYGKQMMFWGDIIRHYPELIPDIPRDVIVLDWGYEYNHDFERIRDFKKAGLEFYGCPSDSGYCALFPRLPQAMANIAGFAASGRKYGARGLLNTDWGDGGGCNFMEYSWHGLLFGAEQSWNAAANPQDFTERFNRLFMQINDRRFNEALDELGRISHLHVSSFYQSIWRHIFFSGARKPIWDYEPQDASIADRNGIREARVTLNAKLGHETLARLNVIRKVFSGHSEIKSEDPLKILPYWIFAVDTLRHAAQKLYVHAPGGKPNAVNQKALQEEHAALRKRFVKLWMARNRRSEIGVALKDYYNARQTEMTFKPPEDKPVTDYVRQFRISRAMPGAGNLTGLEYPRSLKALNLRPRQFGNSLCDLHNDLFKNAKDCLVYFRCFINCREPMRLSALVGYDGPLKLWLDGREIFHDPKGSNPCSPPDKAKIHFEAGRGKHEVLIALSSNKGHAWGIFLRFLRRDVSPGAARRGPKTYKLPIVSA